MTNRSNRRRTRKALVVACVILGVLTAGLLLTSGSAQHRLASFASFARAGEAVGSPGPSPDRADSDESMAERPIGGYGFGGSSLMGLRIGVARGPSQGNEGSNDPNGSNNPNGSNDSNGSN